MTFKFFWELGEDDPRDHVTTPMVRPSQGSGTQEVQIQSIHFHQPLLVSYVIYPLSCLLCVSYRPCGLPLAAPLPLGLAHHHWPRGGGVGALQSQSNPGGGVLLSLRCLVGEAIWSQV